MREKLFRCMSVQNYSESSGQNCICFNYSQIFYLLEREEDFEGVCVLGWGGQSFLMLKYFLLSQLKGIVHIINLPSSSFFLLSNTIEDILKKQWQFFLMQVKNVNPTGLTYNISKKHTVHCKKRSVEFSKKKQKKEETRCLKIIKQITFMHNERNKLSDKMFCVHFNLD